MPIIERDPWRMQYFDAVECPDNVVIPTDDEHAYEMFPEHRWIYNKLQISDTQGMAAAPHGVPPASFPVFSKPIYNLHGMGVGGRIVRSADDLESNMLAGHMWTEFLEGEHVSSDVILIGGEAQWWRHTVGVPIGDGVFDYWTVLAEDKPGIESYCGDWFRKHLRGYSGADYRGPSPVCRSVAGSVRRRVARGGCRFIRATALALRRRRSPRRLQRRIVRASRDRI